MKLVFGIAFLLSSTVSSSQEDREAIFKSMDDSIKVNPAINKAKQKKLEGLNGKVKFIIEDSRLCRCSPQPGPLLCVVTNNRSAGHKCNYHLKPNNH
jgi:hypothetical protein